MWKFLVDVILSVGCILATFERAKLPIELQIEHVTVIPVFGLTQATYYGSGTSKLLVSNSLCPEGPSDVFFDNFTLPSSLDELSTGLATFEWAA